MGKCKYDWTEVQSFYDKNHTGRDVIAHFGMSWGSLAKAIERGVFHYRSMSEAQVLSQQLKPRKHSEETKKKISQIRKKFLEQNPDKVPYLINHYSHGESYPEKYFRAVFENEKLGLIQEYQVGIYSLDFCDLSKKVDIEIDGEQHYLDHRIVLSDKRRTAWLESEGWIIIRIRWSDYQKMSLESRHGVIGEVKRLLSQMRV